MVLIVGTDRERDGAVLEHLAPAHQPVDGCEFSAEQLAIATEIAIVPDQAEGREAKSRLLHATRRVQHAHVACQTPVRGPVHAEIEIAVFDLLRRHGWCLDRHVGRKANTG